MVFGEDYEIVLESTEILIISENVFLPRVRDWRR